MTIKEIKYFVKTNLAVLTLLFIVTLTVYINSLLNGFVSADDLAGYVNNPNLTSLQYLKDNFSLLTLYHFIFKITVGNSSLALHLGSLILHILNVFMAYTFLRLTFGKKVALLGSLLFSVHPAISEAILWISGHGYLHLGFITLICLNLYSLFKKTKQKRFLAASLIVFGISIPLYRYAWLLIIPFLITVLEIFIYENRLSKKSVLIAAPFLIVGALSYILTFYALQTQRINILETDYGFASSGKTPWLNRLPYSLYMMFELLVFPVNLALFHEGNPISLNSYRLMVLLFLSLIPLILILKKKHRKISGLLLLTVLSVLPVFSPSQVSFFIAERYMYVSALFFSVLVVLIAQTLPKITKWKESYMAVLIIILSFYCVRTFVRTFDWRSSKTLWETNARISPYSPRIYNNLGDAYANEKDFEASINSFKKAVELNPSYTDAIHNLGNIYIETGQYQLAKEQYERALQVSPNYSGADTARQILEKLNSLEPTKPSSASQ